MAGDNSADKEAVVLKSPEEEENNKKVIASEIADLDKKTTIKENDDVKTTIKKTIGAGEEEELLDRVSVKIEPKTGVSFPLKLSDGKELNAVGLRRKKILAIGINIYAFGMYSENRALKELLKAKFSKGATAEITKKPNNIVTKEMYEAVIDSGEVETTVRLVIVFGALTMSIVRKNFAEGLGASIKKLNGGRNDDQLVNQVMGAANDSIKLSPGSVIEITRLPGNALQTTVKGDVISRVESELLCRAYLHMYIGDDPFDKEAKENFGASLISLLL